MYYVILLRNNYVITSICQISPFVHIYKFWFNTNLSTDDLLIRPRSLEIFRAIWLAVNQILILIGQWLFQAVGILFKDDSEFKRLNSILEFSLRHTVMTSLLRHFFKCYLFAKLFCSHESSFITHNVSYKWFIF